VHDAGPAGGPAQLEGPLHVQAPDRIAADAGVREQVREHPVLGDVGYEAGAVDDEVGGHLGHPGGGLDAADDHALLQPHLIHADRHGAVPAAVAARLHLGLPAAPERGVGAAHLLVLVGPLLALQPAHLGLELSAPDRLGVVKALIGEAVAALAPT